MGGGFEPSSCAVTGVLPPTIPLASVTGEITQMALLPGSILECPLFIITVCCHMESYIQNVKQVDEIMSCVK